MSEKKTLLTYAGLKEREEELRVLKVVKRKEIAAAIKEAREKGDLSENAEYHAAKDEQAKLEARIGDLEKMLNTASLIDEDDLSTDVISVGSTVTLMCDGEEEEYAIVGSAEANPMAGKISNESPLGSVLIGRAVGDEVLVEAPIGMITYIVKNIS